MHKVLKAFPCSFDGIKSEQLAVGVERDFGSMTEGLKKAGLIGDMDTPLPPRGRAALREDGPTIGEYIGAGYPATGYPPQGYASRSTPEEIAAAVKAEEEAKGSDHAAKAAEALRVDLMKLTVAQLRDKAAEQKVQVADDAKKDDLIDALVVAIMAPQA